MRAHTVRLAGPFIGFATVLMLGACSRQEAPAPATASDQAPAATATGSANWATFVSGFIEARFKVDPYFAVGSGRHEYDGQMPDWSRAAFDADAASLRESLAALGKFDSTTLNPAERLERDYLKWVIETQLFWLTSAEQPFRNPAWYLDRLDPSMYLTREYAPLPKRLEGFLGYARAVPDLAANIRANLRTPLPKAFIERGTAGFGGYATFFRDEMPGVFAAVQDEKL